MRHLSPRSRCGAGNAPLALAVAGALCLGACAAHVQLEPPPPAEAPLEVRRAWFDAHRAARPTRDELELRSGVGDTRPTVVRPRLRLQNNVVVTHVEDLAPLVTPESDAGRAITDAVDARDRAELWTGAGLGVAGAGIGTGLGLFVAWIGFARPEDRGEVPPLLVGGIASTAAGAVAGGALMSVGLMARDEERDARARVFSSWDAALQGRLGLGGQGALEAGR